MLYAYKSAVYTRCKQTLTTKIRNGKPFSLANLKYHIPCLLLQPVPKIVSICSKICVTPQFANAMFASTHNSCAFSNRHLSPTQPRGKIDQFKILEPGSQMPRISRHEPAPPPQPLRVNFFETKIRDNAIFSTCQSPHSHTSRSHRS